MIYVSITIRNAFPCMDEPSFKATFSLQVGRPNQLHSLYIYRVSGLSCPEAQAYLTVIFHSFLHNNNINSDYILGANIYFTPHSIFSSYF